MPEPTTYHQLALRAEAQAGGRFARLTPERITGAPSATDHQPLPIAAWQQTPVPDEPPIDGTGCGHELGLNVSGVGGAE
jgi:hypothetical protein